MMVIPFIVFWVLLYFARDDLGIKGIAIAVLVWSCLLTGMLLLGISPSVLCRHTSRHRHRTDSVRVRRRYTIG